MDCVDNASSERDLRPCLGIFAKQPRPGRVKTRLCPPFSPEQAAAFYRICLEETVERMAALDNCRVVICHTGDSDWFARTFPDYERLAQQGADLGARMAHALEFFLCRGAPKAILVGSDAPDLPRRHIHQALALLDGHDLVLGPARDGGYCLVGERVHHPQLFTGIPWSTERVLVETRRISRAWNIPTAELKPWEDLDDLQALRRLLVRSPQSRVAAYLKALPKGV